MKYYLLALIFFIFGVIGFIRGKADNYVMSIGTTNSPEPFQVYIASSAMIILAAWMAIYAFKKGRSKRID